MQQPSLSGVQNEFIRCFVLLNAGIAVIVLKSDHDTFETLGDLLVGQHNRFEQVASVLLCADVAQIRSDFAAFPINLVAADALRLRFIEEDLFPCGSIASKESDLIGGEG